MDVFPAPVFYVDSSTGKIVRTISSRFIFTGVFTDDTFAFSCPLVSIVFHHFDETNLHVLLKALDSIPKHSTILNIIASGSRLPKIACNFPSSIPDHITYLGLCFSKPDELLFSHLLDNLPIALEVLSLNYFIPLPNPPPSLKLICILSDFSAESVTEIVNYYFDKIDSLQVIRFGHNFYYAYSSRRPTATDLDLSAITITRKQYLSKKP